MAIPLHRVVIHGNTHHFIGRLLLQRIAVRDGDCHYWVGDHALVRWILLEGGPALFGHHRLHCLSCLCGQGSVREVRYVAVFCLAGFKRLRRNKVPLRHRSPALLFEAHSTIVIYQTQLHSLFLIQSSNDLDAVIAQIGDNLIASF